MVCSSALRTFWGLSLPTGELLHGGDLFICDVLTNGLLGSSTTSGRPTTCGGVMNVGEWCDHFVGFPLNGGTFWILSM